MSSHNRRSRRCRPFVGHILEILEPRQLLSVTLSKIADFSTKIPTLIEGKDYGNFTSVSSSVIDGTDIAFNGEGNNGLRGIYLSSNGNTPRTAVDTDTIVSNVNGGGFRMFGEPSLSQGVVSFIGYSKIVNDTATTGVYYVDIANPGVVHTVADTTDGSFSMFETTPSISGRNIAFEAAQHNPLTQHWQAGVYLYDGQDLHTIADENTFSSAVSFTNKFAVSGKPIVDGSGDVAFCGNYYDLEWSNGNGWLPGPAYNQGIYVYSHDTGHVTPAVSTSTAIPNWDSHNFEYFQNLDFTDGTIAFNAGLGYTEPANGIYSNANGTWQHMVGALMSDADGVVFTGIGPSSIDHGNMVFVGVTGYSSTNYGIYAKVGDSAPVKILRKGELLDSKPIWSVYIGNHSLSGQATVINVQFGDSALLAIYEVVDTEILVNRAPVAADDNYTASENATFTVAARGVLSNDSNPDGDQLIATIVTQATYGSVTLHTDGSFVYEPGTYYGTTHFTYQVSDGQAQSEVATVTITVAQQKTGWSSVTHFREAETTIQKTIVAAALAAKDQPSGQSVIGGTWQTDIDGGDGARILSAINSYKTIYWDHRNEPKAGKLLTQAKEKMGAELATGRYASNTVTKLIKQIIVVFNQNPIVPTDTGQAILNYLGIRKQCKEWVDTIAITAHGTPKTYEEGLDPNIKINPSQYRPGMALFTTDRSHAMIIVNIYWDANGNPTKFQVAEANFGGGWSNPGGQIAWARTVDVGRTFPAAGYYDKNGTFHSVKVVSFES